MLRIPLSALVGLLAVAATLHAADPTILTIRLDPSKAGRVFEGIGALSAGASSRLLVDYPEPQRSQILDLLFRPRFGASLHHLKVEIGGDVNSTDGTEPSHARSKEEFLHPTGGTFGRGYEWWLMREAKRRSPLILLDALQWGAPAWIGDGTFYSQDNADYVAAFVEGARAYHRLRVDYVGIWNEHGYDVDYIKRLRRTLDARGLEGVAIVAADEVRTWTVADRMSEDPELRGAVSVVGTHYPGYESTPVARGLGKRLWASEDGPWNGTWDGAVALAKLYNRNYIQGRMTKTIIWSPITAYYDYLPLPGSGLMRANQPWSGSYDVQPAIWATAHTTQFAQPGWVYVDEACGYLPAGGSYVTLRSPGGHGFTIVLETFGAAEQRIRVSFPVKGSARRLHVWRTSQADHFAQLPDVAVAGSEASLSLAPACIYTLTTTTGQRKGQGTPGPHRAFPMPYHEDFESYSPGATPRYLSDFSGAFEVAERPGGGGRCLRQVIPTAGIAWTANPLPVTLFGDSSWRDYEISADVSLQGSEHASLLGRMAPYSWAGSPDGYELRLTAAGLWQLLRDALRPDPASPGGQAPEKRVLAAGAVRDAGEGWHRLQLRFAGDRVRVGVDGRGVASVRDAERSRGFAGLACAWGPALFDNILVTDGTPAPTNLALGRPAAASSQWDAGYAAGEATDGDPNTRWNSRDGTAEGEWLEVDLGRPVRVGRIGISQFGGRIHAYRIQAFVDGDWRDVHSGDAQGCAEWEATIRPVRTQRLRLVVDSTQGPSAPARTPSIYELSVYER